MAMTLFESPENSLNRSRSSSCSSPIRNRIVYHEILSVGSNTLVRSYSCDQVFNKDPSGRTFQTTQIKVASFVTPEKKVCEKSIKSESQNPSRSALKYPAVKPRMLKSTPKTNVSSPGLNKTFLLTLLTASTACALYYYLTFKCSYVWDLKKYKTELWENVFGQDEAITAVESFLEFTNSHNDLHIIAFIGGVGVGKTYSSSIIARNLPRSSVKLLTYSEYFNADVEKLLFGLGEKLSPCGVNLVIVDDLSVHSVREAISLIALLKEFRGGKVNLAVILIFQSQTEEGKDEIIKNLKSSHFNIQHAYFKPLSFEAVRKCFDVEIQRQGVNIVEEEFVKLVEDKLKHIDIVKGPAGCKGVSEEVASYYKNLNE